MRYRINKEHYCDFNTFSINELTPRSYFIPYPDRASADAVSGRDKRYSSPLVKCLNGEWDFKFYARPAEIPDVLDTDGTSFDKIDVPSCWQFRGYDKPFYVNMRTQFPFNPPKIPEEKKAGRTFSWIGADQGIMPRWKDPGEEYNFAGIYRTFFTVEDMKKRHVLSFLGVASCADVYINGRFAGYTEGSHNTAEFYANPFIHAGENEMVVVVRRWCNGTYLECQDMFRNNGIFRDVLLRIEEPNGIADIDFACRKNGDGAAHDTDASAGRGSNAVYDATVRAELYGDGEVTFTLKGHGIEVTRTVRSSGKTAEAVFEGLAVKEWNAEEPVLYDLYFETAGTCVKERIGFRTVKVDGDIYTLNGSKLKFHGVNHHDTSAVNGYTMTPEELERDIEVCKEFNIDTIRTSHYPPDPYLLELADEKGIYIVDEADLETHATYAMQLPPTYNTISHDPKWEAHYVDRAEHLYQRDKMHPSIIMWSLGNESGGYCNTDSMYAYIKCRSDLPIHYESAVHCKKKAYDIASEMYPPVERVHEIGEKTYKIKRMCDRPYFLCEYAHAMGVGPGDMEAYWKEIYSHDSLIGGCVWEMVDHAVLHEDGSYTYGGDHGEWEHDGNFCVDGMFYPDRSPSTGAWITKFIYRPLRVSRVSGNTFEVFNTTGFTPGDAYELRLRWSDGTEESVSVAAGPLEKVRIELPADEHTRAAFKAGKDSLLDIFTIEKATGREAAREQIVLADNIPATVAEIRAKAGGAKASGKGAGGAGTGGAAASAGKTASAEGGSDTAKATGATSHKRSVLDQIISTAEDGVPVQVGPVWIGPSRPYTILFRAPTDNDLVTLGIKNTMAGFIGQKTEVLSVEKEGDRAIITYRIRTSGHTFICTDVCEELPEGLKITSRIKCTRGRGDLPRFGKAYRLDSCFDRVKYYGRNGESYADMFEQTQIEEVSCTVSDMTEPNIRPQESGNRMDCRWVELSDGRNTVRFTALGSAFNLGVKRYSDIELLGMRHREDEVSSGTYVTLSAFQKGIGTGICGPVTAPEYCYDVRQEYEISFLISVR